MIKRTVVKPGDRFHKLTAVKYCYTGKHNRRYFLFACDCGNNTTITVEAATSGNTKSCGCLVKDAAEKRRLPDNRGVINQIILGYKRHARDRGLAWNLSFDEVKNVISQPCRYCGDDKTNKKITKNCKDGFYYSGIDRINSDVGYQASNCVPCCKACNQGKLDHTTEVFLAWIKRVYEHSIK